MYLELIDEGGYEMNQLVDEKNCKIMFYFCLMFPFLIVPLGNRLKNGKSVFCMEGRITL